MGLCDLKFVYPAERDLFGSVVRTEDVIAKEHKAVVDINKYHVFSNDFKILSHNVCDEFRMLSY